MRTHPLIVFLVAYFVGVFRRLRNPERLPFHGSTLFTRAELIERWRNAGANIHSPGILKCIDAGLAPMVGADDDDEKKEQKEKEDAAAKAAQKEIGDKADKLRGDLLGRIKEMVNPTGEDKAEVKKREEEIGGIVDQIATLGREHATEEVKAFKTAYEERMVELEGQLETLGRSPVRGAKGRSGIRKVNTKDRYEGENYFQDLKQATKMHKVAEAIQEHEEKYRGPDREKAWATGDLEDVDLIIPEIQEALPFLQAQARVVQLCREIRTNSPAVEFPVFKSGLEVGHHDDQGADPADKVESDPEFDLEMARVYTIAGLTQVPNSTLEDFPAARGWISTELGRATGIQEARDVIAGDGTGEPLGFMNNTDIPHRDLTNTTGDVGRDAMESAFRAAQQVRIQGLVEPTDIVLNPAIWTDIVLSFEANIGYLYGPPQMEGTQTSGPPLAQPPARILGLPVTWEPYLPTDEGVGSDESPILVGNFQDAIVLRRSPFRIDVDTSLGFRKNRTWFRGEERMGFIVVRPASFVIVDGAVPSSVDGN